MNKKQLVDIAPDLSAIPASQVKELAENMDVLVDQPDVCLHNEKETDD